MILIVGKNSSLYRMIDLSDNHCSISHTEINTVDFAKFSYIILFSKAPSILENIKLIDRIPPEKLVFISSTAVYALRTKSSWSKYPRMKQNLEEYVLSKGGRIVRVGITCDLIKARSPYPIPFTSKKLLSKFINDKSFLESNITMPVEVVNASFKPSWFCMFLLKLSNLLPGKLLFQLPISFLLHFFTKCNYGYTLDSCRFFSSDVQVGFGAIGSAAYRPNRLLLYSEKPDDLITDRGFNLTRVGFNKTGLAKFWHGVYVEKANNSFVKKVPLFVHRKRLPSSAIPFHVKKIERKHDKFFIFDEKFPNMPIQCENLHLAMGAIENCRILSLLLKTPCKLSDHEIGYVGKALTSECVEAGFIRRFLGFLVIRKNMKLYSSGNLCVDVRPAFNKSFLSEEIYHHQTLGIISKLLRRFSLTKINEAFFNKFGVGFWTKNSFVFMQFLSRDCISIDGESIERTRVSLEALDMALSNITDLSSFKSFEHPNLVDGQHVWGGVQLVKELDKKGLRRKISIYGSPCTKALTAFHHTQEEINFYSRK